MEFHLLGSVELSVNGELLAIRSDKRRRLLAALALEVGRPLSHEWLANRIWDEEPPPSALASIYSHVSRIRSELRKAADAEGLSAPRDVPTIDTRSHTYALRTDPQLIDWHRYVDLSRRARQLADNGDDVQARTVLSRAEELWRGEPLAGLPGGWAQSTRATMADQRLATTLLRVEIDLRLGRHSELIPELTALREERPTDERVAAHLLVALHGAGRQAEALAVYPAVVRRLRADLGTAPGAALTRLHERMLRGAPLSGPDGRAEPPPEDRTDGRTDRRTTARPHPARTTPAQRPVPVGPPARHMIGRHDDLRRLLGEPEDGNEQGGVVTVSAILGMAGVGKTTLALHAAHLMRSRFPGGYVHLNLGAHAGNQQPLTTEATATALLRRLGVPAATIPLDTEELFGLCAEVLASRRAVVVLDDASSAAQIRPLLPTAPASLVFVTSRHRLAELPGSRPIFLDILPVDDAVALFTSVVGRERAGDRSRIVEIVDRCGLLPLAIELAASRFKARPSWTLDHLAQRLSRKTGRLAEIRHGSESIARAFEVSYRSLPREQREAFRLLGLYPGPDIGLHAAAALLGRSVDETDQILEALHHCHLLGEDVPERFQLHDLLREYAILLAREEGGPEEVDGAIRRLLGFMLGAADQADRLLYPRRSRLALPPLRQLPGLETLLYDIDLNSTESARDWLDTEQAGLIALAAHAQNTEHPEAAAWLAHVLAGHLDAQAYWSEAHDLHQASVTYWRSAANDRCEARALINLGATLANASRYPAAFEALERGLALARAEEDTDAIAEALSLLGELLWHQSSLPQALAMQEEALRIRRESGDRWNTARCLASVGIVQSSLGNQEMALMAYRSALPLARQFNDRTFELIILNNIGDLHLSAGDLPAARIAFERILERGVDFMSHFDLAVVKINLASSLRIPEELDRALTLYRSALSVFRSVGGIRHEADTLNSLGDTLRSADRPAEAHDQYTIALALARSIGTTREEVAALRGLGCSEVMLGQSVAAIGHLTAAISIARQIGAADQADLAEEALTKIHPRSADGVPRSD
ncbi:BTAD domain-containing putative transcriptional regulator [Streptomyces sp. BE20]|uniref:AfsR/SARP family transcriptional regulator n=1 Tax=Streptomyces sp. BE20 TaxID=3002525 RepID=UPI002E7AA7FA|nr:tetratricopeptide repeat protein [Streptomyces sp. BE20]MEE1823834.1 BTAD domain-containing putative transcriptional regulator [Streptomyces sp. BE20]